VDCYRRSFVAILKSGVENIALACFYAKMHAVNARIVSNFAAFFKGIKVDWKGFVMSDRALNLLTVFMTSAKRLGVEAGSVVTPNVIAS